MGTVAEQSLTGDCRVPDCRDSRSRRTWKAKDFDQVAKASFDFKCLLVGTDPIDQEEKREQHGPCES